VCRRSHRARWRSDGHLRRLSDVVTTAVGLAGSGWHMVADYFMVGVPFAKSLDPVTKTNWEGTGAEPGVKVPAADVLATAEKLAMEQIQAKKNQQIAWRERDSTIHVAKGAARACASVRLTLIAPRRGPFT
jgi:hypothetical protein